MAAVLDPPKLERRATGRIVGGVAGGLADHLRISPVAVRIAFAVLTLAGGLGVIVYAVFWIVVPAVPGPDGRSDMSPTEYAAAALVSIVALASAAWTTPFGDLFIPGALGCIGAALLWRQAGNGQRQRWRQLSRSSLSAPVDERWGRARLVAGAALVVLGCGLVLADTDFTALRAGLEAVAVTVVGVALITGPWWVRVVTELADERRERIRSQERAELAAHLHDSVLQTLTLIQRNAGSPREVTRLARGQERELRRLLSADGAGPDVPGGRLGEAMADAAAEVEDRYAVHVDLVVVGDSALDEPVAALVAATREAMVNAARHAKVTTCSVYVEVEATSVVAYVRDRGVGFDPDAVAEDRQGIRGSVIGRVRRHHGDAQLRSAPGEGTEVRIEVPR